ncbi:acyl-CoA synthetase FdrA [Schnuerera sp. xch1]|uniref:acyl-CoA synthetase FdrA n=1 Tax=Schnuerera sp. xch1 TaxID=2874283 RepID=UPI001CBE9755|nr:acyl-CoA synthetase FdrA [Schnuerera sp. xch1]MBZ2175185.1 acyl-CoA synthetase FdrA [Schnuerera sp. xch1]
MGKIKFEIKKNTYYDSVTLMLISKEVEKTNGVHEALVGMGTDLNKELARNLGIISDEIENIGPNDFFVAVLADDEVKIEKIVEKVNKLLSQKKENAGSDYMPPTLNSALRHNPESNIVLISVAGEYATEEARRALNNNLHVMLFSDNVSLEDEKELKELACEKGLLMMGPDCGTAIINNVPLAFANVIKKGNIGIVGASGTGIQEITVAIDKLGEGVSQVIGTGGRDLHKEIGGLMMLQGIEALKGDSQTKVIVLVSKPPSDEIAEKVIKSTKDTSKPIVINFVGGDNAIIEKYGAYVGVSLEDTARKAVALLKGEKIDDFNGFNKSIEKIHKIVSDEVGKLTANQKYLRGLYTGGTLADEAMQILRGSIGEIYSNIPLSPKYRLKDLKTSREHTCIDFGEDEFTVGRPHPMIDPSIRAERLVKEGEDEEVAVILMDFILGYGVHKDPVGEMIPAIIEAKGNMKKKDRHLSIIASICGTENDPQGLRESQKRLEEAGVIVMPSNAQAVRLAGLILSKGK